MLDQAHLEDKWVKQMGSYMHLEFIKRIYELASVAQWLKIAKRRGRVPEKEFLTVDAQQVNTNPEHVELDQGQIPQEILEWLGVGYLVRLDRQYHRPRLRIEHTRWADNILPQGGGSPLPSVPSGPGCVAPQ